LALVFVATLSRLIAEDAAVRGDFWLDGERSFRVLLAARTEGGRAGARVGPDYVYRKEGDASVRCELGSGAVGVAWVPGFQRSWKTEADGVLRFSASTKGDGGRASLVLIDANGKRSSTRQVDFSSNEPWQRFEIPLGTLVSGGLDLGKINQVEIRFKGPVPAALWFDGVRFVSRDEKREVALTDVRTEDRMADEIATREDRISRVFASRRAAAGWEGLSWHFSNLWNGRNLEETNRDLLAIYGSTDLKLRASYGLEYTWHLQATPMLCRLYLSFGSRSSRKPGRLTPEVEKLILDLIWERTKLKNDLHDARASTWNLTASENHDVNAKVGNVLASQIFMNHPDYARRPLPNQGRGPGSGYWFHITDETGRFHGPEGRAEPTIKGTFHPRDHFVAWVAFMKEYLRERARRGFFLEKSSPGYMKYTISFIQDLYDYCEDEELRKMTGMFLDLIWAEWAQDQLRGIRGGSKTRENVVLNGEQDSMYMMSSYFFGGPPDLNPTLPSFAVSEYRPPAIVWNLALRRSHREPYAYRSHQPGEERPELPRPPGMERTLLIAPESRLHRYSWVAPEFILGTRMDHPLAVHSHLSPANVSQGIIFATSPKAMIFPRGVKIGADEKWSMNAEIDARSVQAGSVLITQQVRGGLTVINPDWFPRSSKDSQPFGLYFSGELDRLEDENGWIFAEEGDAYVAVRVVKGVYQTSVDAQSENTEWLRYQAKEAIEEPLDPQAYRWNPERTMVLLKDRHSPVIIEAGRRSDLPTLDDFKRKIARNPLSLRKTTVPGNYTLHYSSGGQDFYFNAANAEIPQVNGRSIDYFHSHAFDSPYLKGVYGTGVVTVSDGREKMVLDFEKNERR